MTVWCPLSLPFPSLPKSSFCVCADYWMFHAQPAHQTDSLKTDEAIWLSPSHRNCQCNKFSRSSQRGNLKTHFVWFGFLLTFFVQTLSAVMCCNGLNSSRSPMGFKVVATLACAFLGYTSMVLTGAQWQSSFLLKDNLCLHNMDQSLNRMVTLAVFLKPL